MGRYMESYGKLFVIDRHIKSHGKLFAVEGQGFWYARDDFDLVVDRIESTLGTMLAADIARLHVGALVQASGREAAELDDIATSIKNDVTREWYDPSGASVSLIAVPA
jgi:hypothetical protein